MKRLRVFAVLAVAAASLGVGASPASACQPDGPCPCNEEPTKTINNTWNELTGDDFVRCTY